MKGWGCTATIAFLVGRVLVVATSGGASSAVLDTGAEIVPVSIQTFGDSAITTLDLLHVATTIDKLERMRHQLSHLTELVWPPLPLWWAESW